jgi:hypothetical protein
MARFRERKGGVRALLAGEGWRFRLAELDDVPARQLAGPLFSLLLDRDQLVRWRAVEAFGRSIARLADGRGEGEGMEAARVVLRQCLWRMNEESGGLGWGVPEAMGETLARHERLAGEFHRVLASFVREEARGEGNYLEHAALRSGVFWALGRLAQTRPRLLAAEIGTLIAGLADPEGANRGLAARVLGILGPAHMTTEERTRACKVLAAMGQQPAETEFFEDGELLRAPAGELILQAMQRLCGAD